MNLPVLHYIVQEETHTEQVIQNGADLGRRGTRTAEGGRHSELKYSAELVSSSCYQEKFEEKYSTFCSTLI